MDFQKRTFITLLTVTLFKLIKCQSSLGGLLGMSRTGAGKVKFFFYTNNICITEFWTSIEIIEI